MSTVPVLVDAAAREEAAVLAAISASGHDSWSADQFLSSMKNPVARVFSAHCKDDSRSAGTAGYAVIYYDSDGSELVQIYTLHFLIFLQHNYIYLFIKFQNNFHF